MQGSSDCLSAEALTLIMEDRVSRPQRKAWMSHIDRCHDCRTVLAEAAAYVEDWTERTAKEKPASWLEALKAGLNRFPRLVPALAAAALVVAFVGPSAVLYISNQLGSNSAVSAASLVEPLFTGGSASCSDRLWRDDSSGASFTSALAEDQIAFRIGVYLVDLRVALREENDGAARNSLHELEALIPLADGSPASSSSLASIRESVDSRDFPIALSGLDDIERMLAKKSDRFFMRFGEWSEASRLAAVARRTSFFQTELFHDSFEDIRSGALSTPVLSRLQEIERLVVAEDGDTELQALEREFRGLILLY